MARKEIWFNCPLCGRPVRVASRFFSKDFVHPLCGSTLRASMSSEGEPDIELISAPEIKETAGVDLEAIRDSESHGLFLPRHLRKNSPSWAGKTAAQSTGEGSAQGESPGTISARAARVLSTPAGGAGQRDEKPRFSKDPVKSGNLREQFSGTLDDLNSDSGIAAGSGSAGACASDFQQQFTERLAPWERGMQKNPAVREISDRKKFIITVFTVMILVAVIFVVAERLRGD